MARIVLVSLVFSLACHTTEANTAAAKPAREKAKPARVTVINASGESAEVEVEIAKTNDERELGLMNRAEMAPTHGMIFLFPREAAQTFWMKNTLIPLDMIFIRSDMTILGVVEDAEPLTLTPRGVAGQSQYVLETVSGFAHAHHWAAGDRVKFDGVDLAAVR